MILNPVQIQNVVEQIDEESPFRHIDKKFGRVSNVMRMKNSG